MTETEPTADPTADDAADDSLDLPQNLERARELRRENKTLRDRAKAAEEQYAGAAAIVSAMQMAEVRRIAGELLYDPDDLLTSNPDMSAYVDDEFAGMVNADKVVAKVKQLIGDKPHLGKQLSSPPPTNRPIEGLRSGAAPSAEPPATDWASALRGG